MTEDSNGRRTFHSVGDATQWPGHTGNWGRWDNDLGTLNLLNQSTVRRGLGAAVEGRVFALSWPLHANRASTEFSTPAYVHAMEPQRHIGQFHELSDTLSSRLHGMANTHIDALGHLGYRGQAFNGHAWSEVATDSGLTRLDVTANLGIATKGVLVDVPRLRGVTSLEPGDAVQPDDLEAALSDTEPGDAVIIRMGVAWRAQLEQPDGDRPSEGLFNVKIPGLTAACIDLIASHDASVVATDGTADIQPPLTPEQLGEIHLLAEAFYGIPLVHNLNLEELSEYCAGQRRNTFFFSASAVNLPGATGSLASPIGIM